MEDRRYIPISSPQNKIMKIKAVVFDLDGTLLPMDQNLFMKAYFGGLAKRLAPHGYDSEKLIGAIWLGSQAMVKNDGSKTNEEVFWDKFSEIFGEDVRKDEPFFEEYYCEDFDKVSASCGYNPEAAKAVAEIKKMGFRVALGTNPLFPSIATEKRVRWAGLDVSDFEFYTTYENSNFCKPNLHYYEHILKKLQLSAEEVLMVGNDVGEDMIAEKLGMKVFLITDCLINKDNQDISVYPSGSFLELLEFAKKVKLQ